MVTYGVTSDIIVAAMLALGQLITPVPEASVQSAEKAALERNSCETFKTSKATWNEKECEDLRDSSPRKFKKECESLEITMNQSEVQCTVDPEISRVLRFRPRPLAEYMNFSNEQLLEELHTICFAAQDRVYLDRTQWMNGETADRDKIGGALYTLQTGTMDVIFKSKIVEANPADPQNSKPEDYFNSAHAFETIAAICHWASDRKAKAQEVDFRGGLRYLQELINELPRVDRLPELSEASFVYDKENNRIGEIFDRTMITRNGKQYVGGLSRRRNAKVGEVPKMLMNAFISIEDKRFRQHNGFDFEALQRLIQGGGKSATQGGSTFTMQLIKNAWFMEDVEKERAAGKRTVRRKIKEMLMIPLVEGRYSKDEILTYYLNLVSLTPNAQGVKMAAMDLFNVDKLADLELWQMAQLAALVKGITAYNPHRHAPQAVARRNLVLQAMFDQNGSRPANERLSERDLEELKAKPVGVASPASLQRARIFSQFFNGHINNHFRYLKRQNLRDPRWKMGGFDIKTSFDLQMQISATKALQKNLLEFEHKTGRYVWQPWIDPATQKNVNVAAKANNPNSNIEDIFESLQVAHPYPETEWTIALKTPKNGSWLIDGDKRVDVEGEDLGRFRSLKDWDAVLLAKDEEGGYYLAGPTRVQGAVVVLDSETGEVLAMSGGFSAGPYGKFGENNRATVSFREPGSSIKPMTYLWALNHGLQPNSMLRGGKVTFPKIENCPYHWSPNNYRNQGGGSIVMRSALEQSQNRPLANMMLATTGIPSSVLASGDVVNADKESINKVRDTFWGIWDQAVRFGAFNPVKYYTDRKLAPPCFPAMIGGFETTPLNIAQMYAAISNGGLSRPAIFLRQVFKENQPLLIDHTQELREQVLQYRQAVKQGFNIAPQAFGAIPGVSAASVSQLRSLMQGVLRRGTARKLADWADLIGGKTGTTNDSKDAWFSGFTHKMAVIVWVGYDDKKYYPNLGSNATGGGTALPIFEQIMTDYFKAHPEELEAKIPLPSENPEIVAVKMSLSSGRIFLPNTEQSSCRGNAPADAVDEYILRSEVRLPDPKRACEISKLH